MSKKRWLDANMIVALSAVVVSLVALAVGIYESQLERKFQSASVWPRLEVFRSFNNGAFSYQVINSGIGPAVVKSARVSLAGRYFQNWREAVSALVDDPDVELRFGNSHISSRALPPELTLNVFHTSGALAQSLQQNDQLKIELCYCSVFDECWIIDRENKPTSTPRCAVGEPDNFDQ